MGENRTSENRADEADGKYPKLSRSVNCVEPEVQDGKLA